MRTTMILLLMIFTGNAAAADAAREGRLAEEIADMVVEGDPVFLQTKLGPFLSIYNPVDSDSKHAVLVLHGRGLHPNWTDVVRPIRTGLKDRGWPTLALQMPVLPVEAKYKDYAEVMDEANPRLDAGIRYLRGQGYSKIHLVAHSCSTQMTMNWIESGGGKRIDSLVFIGMVTAP